MKMTRRLIYVLTAVLLGMVSCADDPGQSLSGEVLGSDGAYMDETIIQAGIIPTKAVREGNKACWTSGDVIVVNGNLSKPLELEEEMSPSARFSVPGVINAPLYALYPSSIYKSADKVTLPDELTYKGAADAGHYPMLAYAESGNALDFGHPCAVLSVRLTGGGHDHKIRYMELSGNGSEQICGDFTVDYADCLLTPCGVDGQGRKVRVNLDRALTSDPLEINMVMPAGEYPYGYTVTVVDEKGHFMELSTSARTLVKGTVYEMQPREFVPTGTIIGTEIGSDIELDGSVPAGAITISGTVVDQSGKAMAGVVVSDGYKSYKTDADGVFRIDSDLAKAKFVSISIPDGYKVSCTDGLPVFYKRLSELTVTDGVYQDIQFRLEKMSDNRCTLIFLADPQPRGKYNNPLWDYMAFHSTEIASELYADVKTYVGGLSGEVFGMMLGDIVHEEMELFEDYADALKTMGLPMFNVIGNHDYNLSKADDDAGAEDYEKWFGPTNYSFNLCGFHVVVVDGIIMESDGSKLTTSYSYGLTDEVLAWLTDDLKHVSQWTPILFCSHAQMFSTGKSSDRWKKSSTVNGAAYAALLGRYDKVYSWAGHSHQSYNATGKGRTYPNIESHTIPRSTGELWTNEWLCRDGVPRGYVVARLDRGTINWKFKPMAEAQSKFETSILNRYSQPAYLWKDVPSSYDAQLRAYPVDAYGDSYIYANIFFYDEAWGDVYFVDGATGQKTKMEHNATYDMAYKEINGYYVVNNNQLKENSSKYTCPSSMYQMFRCLSEAESGSGYVEVTDRFGNIFRSGLITW